MDWKGRKVVVTGAGGFIGSHLTEELLRRGADVLAIVRYNSKGSIGHLSMVAPELRGHLNVVRAELRDLAVLRPMLEGRQVIFNLAAYVGIPYSYVNPQEVIENNILSTLNLLLVAKENGMERFVQTSTSEVYGSARSVPISESHPYQPQSPYSASKIATDNIALSFHYSFGLPVSIVRPFNTYGPRQSARAVIPSLISQALKGDVIKVGTTTTTRDFTYVADTVQGFLRIAESSHSIGQAINLGTGREISIDDLAQLIVQKVGTGARLEFDASRARPDKSEVQRLLADVSKAKQLAGWEPTYSLERGLELTIEWIRAHMDEFKTEIYNI
ncbi:MAG: GDP-mannose 4,6-dehydratase [Bacteroidetes bacterium]|jgi:dTDP-glucose 4,6-dehydratase|nr:GDP-mannose 4,6-dehydratase [Bacteroidota bacterium]